jgi:hypothetical protein
MKKLTFNREYGNKGNQVFLIFFLPIFLITVCAPGCISTPHSALRDPVSSTPPLLLVQIRSQLSLMQPEVVLPPPVLSGFVLHFIFPCALTNCYLQSSTDLIHWENRYDFSLETNFDGSIGWHLPLIPSRPCEFYRTGGESIL